MVDISSPTVRALMFIRALFASLMVVQLLAGMAAVWVIGHVGPTEEPEQLPWTTFTLAAVLLVVLAVGGYLLRHRLYKNHRRDDGAVEPGAYVKGNAAILTPMAIMGLVGLVIAMLSGTLFPGLLISFAAWIVQIVNLPTGDPLDPGRYDKQHTPKSA